MKKLFIYLFLGILLFCTACGSDKDTEAPESSEVVEEEKEILHIENPKKETLEFVDAHGQWYTTVINPNVKKHEYNWENLTNDASGISYEDENYSIRKGVDVSYYQGTIDWEKVKNAGYDFAILRIGYRGYGESGIMKEDETFLTNLQNAHAAGLDVGAYFFAQAINEEEALEEAYFVLDILNGTSLELPVIYDPELIRDTEARTNDVTGEQFTKNTIVFCNAIEEGGYEPMIYSNMVWEATLFDMEQLQVYPFWYADYEKAPQTPYDFSIWQYSETGTVDGIEGNVDLNIQFIPK